MTDGLTVYEHTINLDSGENKILRHLNIIIIKTHNIIVIDFHELLVNQETINATIFIISIQCCAYEHMILSK